MIELHGVTKTYASRIGDVRALDDVSLEVPAGQFVAVCGASGSGKSTLLSLIGGLAIPTQGKVVVAGRTVSELSPSERAAFRSGHIGFVFQMFHLLPYLNVLDNILVAAPDGRRAEARDMARQLLNQFGLENRMSHRPGQLSAGERQRVATARALLNQPGVLLADEPTGNLDPRNAEGVLDIFEHFHRQGGTVLLVTHDERAAARADRTLQMENGRLANVAAGNTGADLKSV